MKIKFICTGSCGEDHPIHEHCKECHHANFKTTVPYRRGKVEVWHAMLHGPMFFSAKTGKDIDAPVNSKLWKVWERVASFGVRNCEMWHKLNKAKSTVSGVSNCCVAAVVVEGHTTHWYACYECGMPCDVVKEKEASNGNG